MSEDRVLELRFGRYALVGPEQAKDDASAEPAAVQSPGLERMRSTPTRPEE